VKQLERRLIKLEAPTSNRSEVNDFLDQVFEFLTSSELREFAPVEHEVGETLTIQQLQAHPVASEIMLRSATRRERYPDLWQIQMSWRHDIVVPRPWSAEREIEVFRTDIALNWEKRGLALGLGGLTPEELPVLEHLRPQLQMDAWRSRNLPATWSYVQRIAALPEIERAAAKIWFDSRATNLLECHQMEDIRWEPVERPLTLADLKLDPDSKRSD
jgi:hypothetical protein